MAFSWNYSGVALGYDTLNFEPGLSNLDGFGLMYWEEYFHGGERRAIP
ncbi:hypothetical protein MGWOODY_Clf962 [hydrothermal vent metagenome]|uniref:Uncharacterized protein n=1 Tax=hydrothermal vent metagenome TaxID=652676 RepID=A0A160VAM7_9ZZZZ